MAKVLKPDKPFLILSLTLALLGFLFFFSAALGDLWSRQFFISIVAKQFIALILGLGILFFLAYFKKINYKKLKHYSLWFFLALVVLELLVFVPGLGVELGGARRWLNVGISTIQPSEFLKIGVIVFLSALVSSYGKKMNNFKNIIIVSALALAGPLLLLILARDMGTFFIISIASASVLFVAKTQKIHLAFLAMIGSGALLGYIYLFQNYAWVRILSFFGATNDALGADFQIQQSVMAVGSGQIFGTGLGKSLQKFSYLPEPLGDSIFAVTAEEWGFFGSIVIVSLFLAFAYRALTIAKRTKDEFGKLIIIGLAMLIVVQSFFNIAAMMELVPLSGMPLIFISKGGSALLGSLISVGIILHISRFSLRR